MAESDNHNNPRAGNLECGICMESFHVLKVTECAHELCQPCIRRIIEMSVESNTFHCPFCRCINHVPPGGASGFPDKREGRTCHRCKIRTEDNECSHCHGHFCRQCQGSHMHIVRKDLEDVLKELQGALERVDNAHIDLVDFVCYTSQFLRQGLIIDSQAVELYHTAGKHLTRIVNLVQRNETLRRTATQSIPTSHRQSERIQRDQCRSCLRKIRDIASVMSSVIDSFIQHWIFEPIGITLFIYSLLIIFFFYVSLGAAWLSESVYLAVKGITGGIFWLWMKLRRRKDPTRSPFTYVQCCFSFILLVIGTAFTFSEDRGFSMIQIVAIVDWSLLALFLSGVCIGTVIAMLGHLIMLILE